MDYNKFREKHGIDNNAMIELLMEHYPSYSKIVQSMINHPEKYGVRLLPEAERKLKEHFAPKGEKKPEVKRSKGNIMLVRLDDASYDMAKDKMREKGFQSVQDFLEEIIKRGVAE